ncbi:hypothetical protein [Marinobacterium litorale]|uniref:hypothetical protein n=1 Tax=Marinobacterium litorale TaxID=404770 RepID=UPI00048650E2|nr:hypothetical protein [Marinobacterium litorale]
MGQKRRKNWSREQPISLRHGSELCIGHAHDRMNRSVEQIADLMGEASHFTLYKWMESGRMPAVKIRAFEHACGADFVTQYLAHSAGYLLVKVPTGRKAEHRELNELSLFAHEVLGLLIQFYDSHEGADEAVLAVTRLMEDLAFQRGNIEKHQQPELLLGGE